MNLDEMRYERMREKTLISKLLKGDLYKIRFKSFSVEKYGAEKVQVAIDLDEWENKSVSDLEEGDLVYTGDLK